MTLVITPDNSFVHVFSDQSNKVEVTKNQEVKLNIHRTTDPEATQLIDILHKLNFSDSKDSDADNWVLTVKMNAIDLTDAEIQEVIKSGKDFNVELVKILAAHIAQKWVAQNAIAINAFVNSKAPVIPLTEDEQVYQKVLEHYEEVDGEFILKTDGSKTGMTPAMVKEMIYQGLEGRKMPKFEELPIFSPAEAAKKVSDFKEGRFLLGRNKNNNKELIITYMYKGKVEQMILQPGSKANTFLYPFFLFFKKEMTLDEVIMKHSGIDMYVRNGIRFWKNEKGEPTYIVKKIGEGGLGKIYLIINAKEGVIGVLKDAKRVEPLASIAKDDLIKEFEILAKIQQGRKVWGIQEKPHVCGAIPITTKHNKPKERFGYLTQKYDDDYFNEIVRGGGTLEERLIEFHQLLSGLKTLSEAGFFHGDIKLENIFVKRINGKLRVYIADLGSACSRDMEVKNLTDLVSGYGKRAMTDAYNNANDAKMSLAFAQKGNKAALAENEMKRDVFSMGCVMFMALTGGMPFKEKGKDKFYLGFPAEDKMQVKGVPPKLKSFVDRMLLMDVKLRPSAAEAFEQYEDFLKKQYPAVAKKIQDEMVLGGYV